MNGVEESRLVIVSNRAPVTVSVRGDGTMRFRESVGGLTSGLKAYLDSRKAGGMASGEHLWVGWPGLRSESVPDREELGRTLLEQHQLRPVFLSGEDVESYYDGFCNSTIWPLFHYFPTLASFSEDEWESYRRVNGLFADALAGVLRAGDTLWVHDYQLMLLPKLIRDTGPDVAVGFFLHIPFPSYEVFRLLPSGCKAALLEGVLGADLVGFHTHDYAQYFLRCVLNELGFEHNLGELIVEGRALLVDTFPMGIDFDKYAGASVSPAVKRIEERLRENIADKKVIVSIDRLDYTKGISNRLEAYGSFLKGHEEWHGRVVLAMVVVPSRGGTGEYRRMRREINEMVGQINGEYGTIEWTPILYQYKSLPPRNLAAFYNLGDVALVTPIRDGMNLIAKEWVASRIDDSGVLILSEMAGAAKELGEALLVNPQDTGQIANALLQALEMPDEEQEMRLKEMRSRLYENDIFHWADNFTATLFLQKEKQGEIRSRYLYGTPRDRLVEEFAAASHRVLFIDYDGTLVDFASSPYLAFPGPEVVGVLEMLAGAPSTDVVLISGRDAVTLEEWFGHLELEIIAEHGAITRDSSGGWQPVLGLATEWKPRIARVLERCAGRVPGSFVEEKEFSLVWHYRNADPEFGRDRAKKLIDDLTQFTANTNLQVLQGNRVVEVRDGGVGKGIAALALLSGREPDFIMAVGDDWTDEEMFSSLPPEAHTIKVGVSHSVARYRLESPETVIELLESLVVRAGGPG